MMTFDPSEAPMLFVAGMALLLVVVALVLYVTEVRRVGAGSWSECYNDRVAPLPVRKSQMTSIARHHGRARRSEQPSRAA